MSSHTLDLTSGNIKKIVIQFALPYLFASFMQTFYGLVDLFVVGLFDPTQTSTAVSIGSQFMHVITVMIVGLTLGTTVVIGQHVGAGDKNRSEKATGTSVLFFLILSFVLTGILLLCSRSLVSILLTPAEAVPETLSYLRICFAGIPFIVAFNVISSIYRGYGDSNRPMFFVGIACIVNIALDFVFIGLMDLGASGAALGTVCGQAVAVIAGLIYTKSRSADILPQRKHYRFYKNELFFVLRVGFPIFIQEGLIQLAFIIIQVIGNSRGLIDATSIGITEKFIGFLFLVPSAFLSAISAVTAQNYGAGKQERARKALYFAVTVNMCWGILCCLLCELFPGTFISIFRNDPAIIASATLYLRSYSFDVIFASIHFCFSGYFNGSSHSGITFFHNILSAVLIRIPGAWILSRLYPHTLMPMGIAAPAGSLLSVLICLFFFRRIIKKESSPAADSTLSS